MIIAAPTIGKWYRRPNGSLFEVVDFETWPSLLSEGVGAPEDWSGAVDMDPEDFTGKDDGIPQGWHDPLEILEKSDQGTLP